jgi:hypothetical protein
MLPAPREILHRLRQIEEQTRCAGMAFLGDRDHKATLLPVTEEVSMSRASQILRNTISAARSPSTREVEEMATQLWEEAFARPCGKTWPEVEPGSRKHKQVMALARAAFGLRPANSPQTA